MHPGDINQNPLDISVWKLLAEDFATHGRRIAPGFVALLVHRFGNWRMDVKPKLARAPLTLAYRISHQATIALTGIDLPYNVKIGRRVRFSHHGCIVLGAWSVGDDVVFRGSATVGLEKPTDTQIPTIGSGVEIGPRACIVGGIMVGDGALVGPNTVLTEDLAPGAVALGNPAQRPDPAVFPGKQR